MAVLAEAVGVAEGVLADRGVLLAFTDTAEVNEEEGVLNIEFALDRVPLAVLVLL